MTGKPLFASSWKGRRIRTEIEDVSVRSSTGSHERSFLFLEHVVRQVVSWLSFCFAFNLTILRTLQRLPPLPLPPAFLPPSTKHLTLFLPQSAGGHGKQKFSL